MHSANILIPVGLVSLVVCAASVSCTVGKDDGSAHGQSAARSSHNPPGNNGTVKIQEAGTTDEIPDNDPHVGCIFEIEFRGYDEGDLTATWALTAQPPSGMGTAIANGDVDIGADPPGGAPDLDGLVTVNIGDFDLSGLTRHPTQGYHLKLEVHAEGSIGADTKFKVFWVEGCEVDAGGSTSSTSSGGSTSSTSSGGSTSSTSSGGSSSGRTW